jgi:hypothetical protein
MIFKKCILYSRKCPSAHPKPIGKGGAALSPIWKNIIPRDILKPEIFYLKGSAITPLLTFVMLDRPSKYYGMYGPLSHP